MQCCRQKADLTVTRRRILFLASYCPPGGRFSLKSGLDFGGVNQVRQDLHSLFNIHQAAADIICLNVGIFRKSILGCRVNIMVDFLSKTLVEDNFA